MLLKPWLIKMVVTGLGTGMLPKAPGTWGSILGLALGWWLYELRLDEPWLAALVFGGIGAGAYGLIRQYEADQGHHDSAEIVIDEILGLALVYMWVPASPLNLAVGFGLFRFFDITKLGPVGWCERRWHGHAAGTLLDDLVAGVMVVAVFGCGDIMMWMWLQWGEALRWLVSSHGPAYSSA